VAVTIETKTTIKPIKRILQQLLKHDLSYETLTTKTEKEVQNANPLYLN